VNLIETARVGETVATAKSVSGFVPERLPQLAQAYSRRDVLGCSRKEKNGAKIPQPRPRRPTTSGRQATTRPKKQEAQPPPPKKIYPDKHQKSLDKFGSFREGLPDASTLPEHRVAANC